MYGYPLWRTCRAVGVVVAVTLAQGCAPGGGFTPPPPPDLEAIRTGGSGSAATRTLEMILDATVTPDRDALIGAGRQEAGKSKAIFNVSMPRPGDPPARQADLVRAAVSRGVSALIVEPTGAPEVSSALAEARTQGIPIILLDRSLNMEGPKPTEYPRVRFTAFPTAAEPLVDSLMADIAQSKLPKDARALILVDARFGDLGRQRAAVLEASLKKRGIPAVEIASFESNADNGRKLIIDRAEADPKIHILVAIDNEAVNALTGAYDDLKSKRSVSMIGFMIIDTLLNPNTMTNFAGLVDLNVPSLSREAVRQAIALIEGTKVPNDIEVPLPLRGLQRGRSPGLSPDTGDTPPDKSPN